MLGTALANAGRGADAAAAFLEAARLLKHEPDADGRRILKWRQKAAEQQLQAGDTTMPACRRCTRWSMTSVSRFRGLAAVPC